MSITTPPARFMSPELASHTRFFSLRTAKQFVLTCFSCMGLDSLSGWSLGGRRETFPAAPAQLLDQIHALRGRYMVEADFGWPV